MFSPMHPIGCHKQIFSSNTTNSSSFIFSPPLLLLSRPSPKVTQPIAPYSHQLTPPAHPVQSSPPHLAPRLASQCPPPFLPSFLYSTQPLPYPAHGYSLAGPIALWCLVINESFHTHGLSWLLGRGELLALQNS